MIAGVSLGEAADPPIEARVDAASEVPDAIRRRLRPISGWTWTSWAATAWIAVIAAILRFVDLGRPTGVVFDEVYYAVEGQELLDHGVEWRTLTDPAGVPTGGYGDYVVHPPLGKWIIGLGIKMFGNDSFGWRFMCAVAGVLSVVLLTRIARRMFRSTVLGCAAGLLMALDGMHLVLSRIAILDIFVMFFVLAAFGCLVLDRDARRDRWLHHLERGLDPRRSGPAGRLPAELSGVRWWRLAAGVMLGAGTGVKWSAIFFVPVFMLLVYLWEAQVRRTVGARHPWRDALLGEAGWIAAMGVCVVGAYLASWTGWFISDDGWKRHYLNLEKGEYEPFVLGALYNLWAYHVDVLRFHETLHTSHPYQSWPWQWLLLGRPVSFYKNGDPLCDAPPCHSEILLLGTPVLWWSFLPALAGLCWFGISRRDWRAPAILVGVVAGIGPWFYYALDRRTMYYFYALPAEPFLVLAVVYCLGALMAGPGVGRFANGRVSPTFALPSEDRRLYGTIVAAGYMLLVALCFWWYYPLYVGGSIPYQEYLTRLLLGNRWA
jgi:dolichyl-phosphate-mannose--protein O-mannosyl transferase